MLSYNCRGWKSGNKYVQLNLLPRCDICLIQEHWLITDHLSALDVDSGFLSVSVSGMDTSSLIRGRPYGGCAILYRKWLAPCITRHELNSNRFCSITIDSNSFKSLLICVYLPTNYNSSQSNDSFLETIGELKGYVNSMFFDNLIIAGDFNVDFSRSNVTNRYLNSFMSDLNLVASDVQPKFGIKYTYRRDDGLAFSWPDHVLTLSHHSQSIRDIRCWESVDNFSDHLPLEFSVNLDPLVFECIKSDCTNHQKELDVYCESLFSCIKDAALHSLPQSHTCGNRKVTPGWNKFVLKHRHAAVFWNRVWHEAGSPSTVVLSQLKKLAKN